MLAASSRSSIPGEIPLLGDPDGKLFLLLASVIVSAPSPT